MKGTTTADAEICRDQVSWTVPVTQCKSPDAKAPGLSAFGGAILAYRFASLVRLAGEPQKRADSRPTGGASSPSSSTFSGVRGGSVALGRAPEADVNPHRESIHDHPVPLLAGQSRAHAARSGRHRPDSA